MESAYYIIKYLIKKINENLHLSFHLMSVYFLMNLTCVSVDYRRVTVFR